jgi:steroid 5-alpha reductase family enzyme
MISEIFGFTAVAIATTMLLTWLLSLMLSNASIVDVVWGLGFVLVAWVAYFVGEGSSTTGVVVLALCTAWGLRLAGYLWWRNHGKGEDFRYVAMRKHYGERFAIISLVSVFGLQGVLMWAVSVPLQLAQQDGGQSFGLLGAVGVILWTIGITFETVGDLQLSRFKSNPDNVGKVMSSGLWRYTRHPNYFGDACVWWGMAIVALPSNFGWVGLFGAAAMNFLLLRVSGVPMLEKTMHKRRPEYVQYQQRTSGFFPRPPRR